MSHYRYSISLRLRHPRRDAEAVTDVLGLRPSRSWRAGDRRATPGGEPLEGVYKESYGTAKIAEGSSEDSDLAGVLGACLDRLDAHREFLLEFVASGGSAEFFVGWYFPEGNSGDVLDWRLLQRLADLRIALSLDVYAQ